MLSFPEASDSPASNNMEPTNRTPAATIQRGNSAVSAKVRFGERYSALRLDLDIIRVPD